MHVAHILTDPSNDWKKVLSNARGRNRYAFREIQVNWKKYNPFDYCQFVALHCIALRILSLSVTYIVRCPIKQARWHPPI